MELSAGFPLPTKDKPTIIVPELTTPSLGVQLLTTMTVINFGVYVQVKLSKYCKASSEPYQETPEGANF